MHYVLRRMTKQPLGGASLPAGKVRIFIRGGPADCELPSSARIGKFTPIDDEMRLYLGVAQDIAVRRTIEKREKPRVAGNLSNQRSDHKVRNRKLQGQGSLRWISRRMCGPSAMKSAATTGRDVQWELGKETNFDSGPDPDKSTFEKVLFHVNSAARSGWQVGEDH